MRFVSVRKLRNQSASVWKVLSEEKDLVITSNGKPIALLSAMVEEDLEASLGAVRRARAQAASTALQQASLQAGTDRLSLEDINSEINAATPGTRLMRIVLDTNVLVSGLLSPFGPPGDIVRLITTGTVRVCYDARILGEYRRVLPAASFLVQPSPGRICAGSTRSRWRPRDSAPSFRGVYQTQTTRFFLLWLSRAKPTCLVTGNLRHYPASRRQGVQVVSPRNFLELYRKMAASDDL